MLSNPIITKTAGLLQKTIYNYIPPSCYNISQKVNPVLKITLGNSTPDLFTLKIRLFENVVPKTSENFKRLLLGNANYKGKNYSLLQTGISRYVAQSFIQFGDIPQGNHSIYGRTFRDQSFELLHNRPGLLSSVSQQNTNDSRFLITLAPCPFLDYKNVVFGQVIPESMKTLRALQRSSMELSSLRISAVEEIVQQAVSHAHHH